MPGKHTENVRAEAEKCVNVGGTVVERPSDKTFGNMTKTYVCE